MSANDNSALKEDLISLMRSHAEVESVVIEKDGEPYLYTSLENVSFALSGNGMVLENDTAVRKNKNNEGAIFYTVSQKLGKNNTILDVIIKREKIDRHVYHLLLLILMLSVVEICLSIFFAHIFASWINSKVESLTEQVKKSKDFLQNVIDAIPDSLMVVGLDYKINLANHALVKNTGTEKASLAGLSCYNVSHHRNAPCEGNDDICPHKEVIAKGRPVMAIHKHFDCRGDSTAVEVWASPIFDDKGKVNQVVEMCHDITESIRYEEELESLNQRFYLVMDGLDALVYVSDLNTNEILYLNKYGRDIWGDYNGKICWKTLQAGQTGPCDFCTNKYLLDSNGNPSVPYIWEFKNTVNGRWYECRDQAIQWTGDRFVRLEIATDITFRKQAEEELRKTEERLRQTQKIESLEIMAGSIAHNFNNILTIVLGNLEFVLSDPYLNASKDLMEMIEAATRAAKRAAGLSRLMLTYVGQGIDADSSINLSELLESMVGLLDTLISEKISYRMNLANESETIQGSQALIQQLIINLFMNALEAIGENEGSISISSSVVECDKQYLMNTYYYDSQLEGSYVIIAVSDTGCGMDYETQAKAFDPFFTTKFIGRGLGLAAVLGIVRKHKGAIKIHSKVGEGTVIETLFPVMDTDSNSLRL